MQKTKTELADFIKNRVVGLAGIAEMLYSLRNSMMLINRRVTAIDTDRCEMTWPKGKSGELVRCKAKPFTTSHQRLDAVKEAVGSLSLCQKCARKIELEGRLHYSTYVSIPLEIKFRQIDAQQ
jgi:hypothetical protein